MQPRRPTSVLVVAIFHLIFGTIGLLVNLTGVGFGAFALTQPRPPANCAVTSNPPTVADSMKYVDAHVPLWRELNFIFAVLGLVLSVALLAAGVGLLLMQPWARWLSVAYAVGSMVLQAFALLFTIVWVMPVQMGLYDQMPPPPGMNAAQAQTIHSVAKFGVACGTGGALLGLVYPIIVLIVMMLPSVAAAFRGQPAATEDFGGREDERRRHAEDYGDEPRGHGREPDDRFGPAG